MAALKIVVLCSIFSLAVAASPHLSYAPAYKASDYYAPPQYKFDYGVKDPHTGDYKSQWEAREGDVVKGSYSVVDPDGSVRTVDYTADDHNGFNAVVKTTGAATHPQLAKPVLPVLPQVSNVVSQPVYLSPAKTYVKPQSRPVTILYSTAPKNVHLSSYDASSAYAELPAGGQYSAGDAGAGAYPAPQPALPPLPAPQPQAHPGFSAAQLGGAVGVYAQQPSPAAFSGLPLPQSAYAAPEPAPAPVNYRQLYRARLVNTAAAAYGSSVPGASQQTNNPGPVLFPVNPEDRTPAPPRNVPPQFALYQQGSAAVRAGSTVAAVNTAINQLNQNQQPQPFLPQQLQPQQLQYSQLPQHLQPQPQNVLLGQAY